VGSVVGGKDAQAAVVEAAAWSAALLIGSGVLASIGGAIARRTPARDGLLPPPISLFATVVASTIFLLLVTELNDVAQYCWGKAFGRHKITPRVSPNKTWEGLVGGLLAGVAVAVGLGWLAGIDLAHLPGLLITSVVAVLASVLGDLFESLIKRHAGAKDSGNLIPGHGGVLDRVDGVLAAVPVFALGKEIFGF
jgi:CDP-diglyceride synthetase